MSPSATSLVDVMFFDFMGMMAAGRRQDRDGLNAAAHRLAALAHVGHYDEVEELVRRHSDASLEEDDAALKRSLIDLGNAIAKLPRPALSEAADRGAITAAQLAYVEFIMAQKAQDAAGVKEWLTRLQDAAELGDLTALRSSVEAVTRAFWSRDQSAIQDAVERLYDAVRSLPR